MIPRKESNTSQFVSLFIMFILYFTSESIIKIISPYHRNEAMSSSHANSRPLMLPKVIHDELRMSVALRGYSTIRDGDVKNIAQQQQSMEEFYHGKLNKSPSQIQMTMNPLIMKRSY